MKVIKRNGESAEVRFDQITERIKFLASNNIWGDSLDIAPALIAQTVCSSDSPFLLITFIVIIIL
jgi:hypothetical protein